jgi:hypothetical protein
LFLEACERVGKLHGADTDWVCQQVQNDNSARVGGTISNVDSYRDADADCDSSIIVAPELPGSRIP